MTKVVTRVLAFALPIFAAGFLCLMPSAIDESANPGLYAIAFNVFSRGPTVNETFPLAAAICVPLPDNPPVGVEPSSV